MMSSSRILINRAVSVIVLLAMFFTTGSAFVTADAVEKDFEAVTLLLNAPNSEETTVDLYLYNSEYFIAVDDLCELTRCSSYKEKNTIYLTQGIWDSAFDIENQVFVDLHQSVPITILKVSANQYAVPALVFLDYFNATAFIVNNTLYCRMPEVTAWEALNVDYADTLVDIYELYGGEGSVKFSLTLDIIMDFFMGNMGSSDDYIDDAFVEALKVELSDYKSVKKYKELSQEKLYADLNSDCGIEFVEAIEDLLPVAEEPTKWYIQRYYNSLEESYVRLAYLAAETGQNDEIKRYGRKFYEAFEQKNRTNDMAEKCFEEMDYVMLFVSSAVETAQSMKYVNATNNLIYNVMGRDNLNYLGISVVDSGWFSLANKYKNVLGVAETQVEAEVMKYLTDKLCWETLIGTGVSSAAGISVGAWTFSLNLGRLVAKTFPLTKSSIDAFEADRMAIYLSEMQQNVFMILENAYNDIQNDPTNKVLYSKYIQAAQLYCRTSIAMYENLILMVDEFGNDPEKWKSIFQARIDKLAVSLYQLTLFQDDGISFCIPSEISALNDVSETEKVANDNTAYSDYYSVVLPEHWTGHCRVSSYSENSLYFNHKESEDAGYGGFLFSIALENEASDYDYRPQYDLIGYMTINGVKYHVVTFYPSDVQFPYEKGNESIASQYRTMTQEIPDVIESLTPINGATFEKAVLETSSKESLYINPIRNIFGENYAEGSGEGLLYDIDGDGVNELVLMYHANIDAGYGTFPHMVCDVYTICDGRVVTLLDQVALYTLAGGPSGRTQIVNKDGNVCVAITWESGETSGYPTMRRGGEWYVYSIGGHQASLEEEVEYDYTVNVASGINIVLYDESNAVIDGKAVKYDTYEKWCSSMKVLASIDGINSEWVDADNGLPIGELVETLS